MPLIAIRGKTECPRRVSVSLRLGFDSPGSISLAATSSVHAGDTYLPQRIKGLGPKSESLDLLVTLITPSWNQVVGFLTDWEGFRRLAA